MSDSAILVFAAVHIFNTDSEINFLNLGGGIVGQPDRPRTAFFIPADERDCPVTWRLKHITHT